jgi:hypothetical protein
MTTDEKIRAQSAAASTIASPADLDQMSLDITHACREELSPRWSLQ